MRTSATNRKVRSLMKAIADKTLISRPEFQRRLVWSNKDKERFLDTVLLGFPFPEIYMAAGKVNLETGEGTELLVDGQQRISTLFEYFNGSEELELENIGPYSGLPDQAKKDFLEYEVVVRDLGSIEPTLIVEVFQRINSTNYSLNDMEIRHAVYQGEFMKLGRLLAEDDFFERHRTFNVREIRRMLDTRFALELMVTIMSTYFAGEEENEESKDGYFTGDELLEEYLKRYNDTFPDREKVYEELQTIFAFIEECNFPPKSRVWKKGDLFTLIIELDRAIYRDQLNLRPKKVSKVLNAFYEKVEASKEGGRVRRQIAEYYSAALQGTNNRANRVVRGRVISELIHASNPLTSKSKSVKAVR